MAKKLLTVREVSDLVGIPQNTLRTWRAEGRGFPVVKMEGRVYYRSQDIEAYIDAHTEIPTVRDMEANGVHL